MRAIQVAGIMERLAPARWAEEWDNVGLVVGDPAQQITGILVALTVTEEVVQAAAGRGANLIVSHHPPWLKLAPRLRPDAPAGRLAALLIKKEMAVVAAHTNLDVAPEGVNKWLADRLGLRRSKILWPRGTTRLYKVAVFIPRGHEDHVREAMGRAGAGFIGNYSFCTFQAAGTGTFLPQEGTHPYLGQVGELSRVEEVRLETIVPEARLHEVIEAMVRAHPYEEVAYDIYPLANRGAIRGLGRIGELETEVTLQQFSRQIESALQVDRLKIVGEMEARVSRVAVCGGAGSSLIGRAKARGAQVFVTGDVDYHRALEAKSLGLAIIDAGHEATERPVLNWLATALRREVTGVPVTVYDNAALPPSWG